MCPRLRAESLASVSLRLCLVVCTPLLVRDTLMTLLRVGLGLRLVIVVVVLSVLCVMSLRRRVRRLVWVAADLISWIFLVIVRLVVVMRRWHLARVVLVDATSDRLLWIL